MCVLLFVSMVHWYPLAVVMKSSHDSWNDSAPQCNNVCPPVCVYGTLLSVGCCHGIRSQFMRAIPCRHRPVLQVMCVTACLPCKKRNGEQKVKKLSKKSQAFVEKNSNYHEEGSSHRIFNKFSSTEAQLYTWRQDVDQPTHSVG